MKGFAKTIYAFIFTAVFSLALAAGSVFAWLIKTEESDFGITALVHKSYYESGNGSMEYPFEIAYPIQLYYFAWLYNLGYYNDDPENSGASEGKMSAPVYFRVSKDLDMSGYVLPSVGTWENPFVGVFDGEYHTISNLTVTNASEVTHIPTGGNDLLGATAVGFFGVMGGVEGVSADYETGSASISNFALENVTVNTETPVGGKSLIGVVAGYVNGAISGVAVYESAIFIAAGVTALNEIAAVHSEYSTVGYCADGSYLRDLVSFGESEVYYYGSGGGEGGGGDEYGDDWGGSLNFMRMHGTLWTIINEEYPTAQSANRKLTVNTGDIHLNNLTVSAKSDVNPSTNVVIYRYRGGTFIPFHTDDISANPTYIANMKNTGYIIGSDIGTGANASPRSAAYRIDYINNSMTDAAADYNKLYSNTHAVAYDSAMFESLTYQGGSWKRIEDGYNAGNSTVSPLLSGYQKINYEELGLGKYASSREVLDRLLYDRQAGVSRTQVHGIHFDSNAVRDASKFVAGERVVVNGAIFDSGYEFPAGCIDFSLKTSGVVNFFAGSYRAIAYSSDRNGLNAGTISPQTYFNDSFFSLHEIKRSSADGRVISEIREIRAVYRNPDAQSDDEYVYRYRGEDVPAGCTAADIVFDMETLWSGAPVPLAVYYFEIPLNAGEYAMGAATTDDGVAKNNGAYLIYLDISVSAGGEEGDGNFGRINRYSVMTVPKGIMIAGSETVNGESVAVYSEETFSDLETAAIATDEGGRAIIRRKEEDGEIVYRYYKDGDLTGTVIVGRTEYEAVKVVTAPAGAGITRITVFVSGLKEDASFSGFSEALSFDCDVAPPTASDFNLIMLTGGEYTLTYYGAEDITVSNFTVQDGFIINTVVSEGGGVTVL